MNYFDPLSSILLQIDDLVASLTKKTAKNVTNELLNLASTWGPDAELHLLRGLISAIDSCSDSRNPFKETVHTPLLRDLLIQNAAKASFSANFCSAFDTQIKNSKVSSVTLAQFFKSLRLTRVHEVILGFVLLQSNKNDTRNVAFEFLKKKLPELLSCHTNPNTSRESGIFDCSVELIHYLLLSISRHPKIGVQIDLIDNFIEALKREFPQDRVPIVLAPFLYNTTKDDGVFDLLSNTSLDEQNKNLKPDLTTLQNTMDSANILSSATNLNGMTNAIVKTITGSLALQIQEIGYGFCQDVDSCQKHLNALGAQTLTASNLAHILAMMVRTHSNLKNGTVLPEAKVTWIDENKENSPDDLSAWKVENFVQVVQTMVPNMSWNDVITELDHPGFAIKDRTGLALLTKALLQGLRDLSFPVHLLYKMWANKEGQLSWLQQMLRHPDVFCLIDYAHRPVQTVDIVKATPEEPKEVQAWRSLDLIDVLLSLGDVPGLSGYVQECLRFPVQSCPELLALGLIQTTLPMTLFRQELLVGLFQLLLGGLGGQQAKENRLLVFSFALTGPVQSQTQLRQCVLHAMAEWYNRNVDILDRLTKIFQVAIKLKILLDLLSLPQFQFTIDLACLASRCDYVNLNRWLTEKIQANGEPFVQACVQFLKRRLPTLAAIYGRGGDPAARANAAALAAAGGQQLSLEIVSSVLTLLKSVSAHVQPTLAAEIADMSLQFANLAATATPVPAAGIGPPPPQQPPLLPSVASTPNLGAIGGGGSSLSGATGRTPVPSVGAAKFYGGTAPGGGGIIGVIGSAFGSGAASGGSAEASLLAGASLNPLNFGKVESVPAHLNSTGGGAMPGSNATTTSDFPFGNPNFQNAGLMGATASPSALMAGLGGATGSAPFNDPLTSLLKPSSSGWGAGFGTGSGTTSVASMLPTARTVSSIPPSLNTAAGVVNNEPNNPDITQTFAEDIQEEANGYFQQIYTQPPQPSMSIEQFLDVLKRFRDSSEKKQLDVFACMIKNLFEEYNFFEQYPEKELHTTALLFGGVVREGLVSGMPLMFALRVVFEAIKKDVTSKLYGFGTVALDQFRARLKEFPRYCQSLIQLPRVQQLQPRLLEYIQYGSREEWPPSHQQAGILTRSQTPAAAQLQTTTVPPTPVPAFVAPVTTAGSLKPAPTLNATNIDTLVHATAKEDSKVTVPSETITEKVAFLFNNLSQMNMTQKVTEMKSLILDEHMPWFSQYLVMKRVSAESNFHNLYANFVTALGNKLLNALSLKETYRNIKILLRSDKAAANFSDRTLLKNLGHWLGMSSLLNNKPILHKDLDLKSLLLEAFWKGQQELLYVVPFICKILESCQKSRVFKPPNPWTKAILSVLAELHQQPDLKLNLKFEIEVLFRHLNMELSAVKILNILKDPIVMERAVKEPQLSNPQRLEKPTMTNTLQPSPVPTATIGSVMGATMPTAVEEHANVAQTSVTPVPVAARFAYQDIFVNNFHGLSPHISVNASLAIFQVNPPLKHLVKPAIEHAIHELMVPVADRAIKIAMTTTENVIKKDFGLDSDENRMRLAAQNMARSLTAGMAMITCRDPLFYGIQGYLKQGFYSQVRGATTEQQRMIEEAVQAITEDNVELAQCFIVKFAAERVCVEIDKRLSTEFDARRLARAESRSYASPNVNASALDRLPDSIRPRQGAPDGQQLAVYEEFGRQVPGFKPAGSVTTDDLFAAAQAAQTSSFQSQQSTAPRHFWTGATPTVHSSAPVEDETTLFQQLLRDIENRLQMSQSHMAQNMLAFQGVVAIREALASSSQNPRDTLAAQALLQKLVDIMLEFYAPRLITPQQQHLDQGESKEWNILLSEAFMSACKTFTFIFGAQWVQKQVTKTLIDCRQESRFNVDAIELLTRNNLVNMITYDLQLATAMDQGLNYKAIDFAQHLVRRLFVEQRSATHGVLAENDLSNTIDMLNRIGGSRMGASDGSVFGRQGAMDDFSAGFNRGAPTSLSALMAASGQSFVPNMTPSTASVLNQLGVVTPSTNMAAAQAAVAAAQQQQRGSAAAAAAAAQQAFVTQLESGVMFVREYSGNDPPGLQEKAEYLLREWVEMLRSPQAAKDPSKAFSMIVSQMHQHGILKSDDLITRFFRLCTEMSIDLCYRALSDVTVNPSVARARCFHTLDSFALLIVLLVKHSGDGQHATKVNLLQKILGLIAGTLLQDHKVVRRDEFHQLPYHRLFMTLFLDLTSVDAQLEPVHMEILASFCQTLHVVQPRYNPGFTFAWLDIIGHRTFIGRVLVNTSNQKAWSMYAQLLTDHLRFLAPFLRNVEFQKPVALVYVGTLRILLVLLHDLPELLCDYHYALCDVIPPNCVQLRNLILSAYPRNMRLPDPFMPNLKVDQLPEINSTPRISVNFAQAIQPVTLKNDLDAYLKNRAPVSFLSELRSKLQISNEPGQKYNISLMNAVVLYVGAQAIQAIQLKEQRPSISTIAHTAHMDIFQNLAVDLDTEGRYLFFNAIANQLRYPNSHTHYFSCTLLYLFAEANSEAIQEQITRILFERLVALRPHPWGLLITFIELIKNPYYKFWTHQFVRCAPEIENLFDSIARSCMVKMSSTNENQ